MKKANNKVYSAPEAEMILVGFEERILSTVSPGNTPPGPETGEPGEWDD